MAPLKRVLLLGLALCSVSLALPLVAQAQNEGNTGEAPCAEAEEGEECDEDETSGGGGADDVDETVVVYEPSDPGPTGSDGEHTNHTDGHGGSGGSSSGGRSSGDDGSDGDALDGDPEDSALDEYQDECMSRGDYTASECGDYAICRNKGKTAEECYETLDDPCADEREAAEEAEENYNFIFEEVFTGYSFDLSVYYDQSAWDEDGWTVDQSKPLTEGIVQQLLNKAIGTIQRAHDAWSAAAKALHDCERSYNLDYAPGYA